MILQSRDPSKRDSVDSQRGTDRQLFRIPGRGYYLDCRKGRRGDCRGVKARDLERGGLQQRRDTQQRSPIRHTSNRLWGWRVSAQVRKCRPYSNVVPWPRCVRWGLCDRQVLPKRNDALEGLNVVNCVAGACAIGHCLA